MTLLFAYSCSNADNNIIKPNSKMGAAAACAPNSNKTTLSLAAAPTYQGNIKTIFDSNCLGCHNPTAGAKKKPYFDTYVNVKANANSGINSIQSTTKPMPPSGPRLAAGNLKLLQDWVAAGSPEGSLAPSAPTNTATPTNTSNSTASSATTPKVVYSGEIEQLLRSNCTKCHGPGMTSPDLSSYNAAKDAASGAWEAMKDGSMPTSGKLPPATIDKFKKWIDDGLVMKLTDSSAVANCGN